MIKIEALFCEDCIEKAEKIIRALEEDINALKKIIDGLKADLITSWASLQKKETNDD